MRQLHGRPARRERARLTRARPRLIDWNDANLSLCCDTCQDAEEAKARKEDRDSDRSVGDLSDGGNNLTRTQASMRAAAHLRKYPTHVLSWTAMGSTRRAP